MNTTRLEAFSDGVIAIIITIMVLELKVPHGENLAALAPVVPVFLSYVLSFVYVGIYWNNHHHMLHAMQGGERRDPLGEPAPAVLAFIVSVRDRLDGRESPRGAAERAYGAVLLDGGARLLDPAASHHRGAGPGLAAEAARWARDWKGKLSPVLYVARYRRLVLVAAGSRRSSTRWWRSCGWCRTDASSTRSQAGENRRSRIFQYNACAHRLR